MAAKVRSRGRVYRGVDILFSVDVFLFCLLLFSKRGLAAKAFCALFLDEQKSNVFNPSLSLSLSLSLPRQKM